MISQLDILSKVMISLKEEQVVAMDNIQALLNNRDKEVNVVNKIKKEFEKLSLIESKMQQNEFFMIQIQANNSKEKTKSSQPK